MSNEIKGKLIVLNDTQTFPSGFRKREFVIEEIEGEYPQKIKFEVVKERCDALDKVPLNSLLTVHYNLRGNEYNGKYYVSLQCWRFGVDGMGKPSGQPKSPDDAWAKEDDADDEEGEDSIPF